MPLSNTSSFKFLCLSFLLGACSTAHGIANGDAPDTADTRFDAVGALSNAHLLGQDPTHPNAQSHNWYCSAVLIDANTVLTAGHCVADSNADYVIRFRRHTGGTLGTKSDGPESYFHASVKSLVLLTNRDMAVLTLDNPVSHIDPIPVLTQGQHPLTQTSILNAGWGREGPGLDEGPLNELLLCENTATARGTGSLLFGSYPCGVRMHDSGGPLLIEGDDNELRVAGITVSPNSAHSTHGLQDYPSLGVSNTPFISPDLYLEGTIPSQRLKPGESINFGVLAGNNGQKAITNFTVEARLMNGLDEVGRQSYTLSGKPGPVQKLTMRTDSDLPAGNYRLEIEVDPDDNFEEVLETNNFWPYSGAITISPARHDVKMARRAVVIEGDITGSFVYTGEFAVAERNDGSVVVVGGLVGSSNSLVYDQKPGEGPGFQVDGSSFALQDNDGKLDLVSTSSDLTVFMTPEESDLGLAGYVHGVYLGWTHTTSSSGRPDRAPAGAIVFASGLAYLAGEDIGSTLVGTVNSYDDEIRSPNGERVDIDWNDRRQTIRLLFSDGASQTKLFLQTQ